MKSLSNLRYIKAIPLLAAVLVGGFLTAASSILDWSSTSTLVVGIALVAMLGLFGTPLLLLDFEDLARHVKLTSDFEVELDTLMAKQMVSAKSPSPIAGFERRLERQKITPSDLAAWHRNKVFDPNQPRFTATQIALGWGEGMSLNPSPGQRLPALTPTQQRMILANPKNGDDFICHYRRAAIQSVLN